MTKKELRKYKRMGRMGVWEWLTTNIYNEPVSKKALVGNVVFIIALLLLMALA